MELEWYEQLFVKLRYKESTFNIYERASLQGLIQDKLNSMNRKVGKPPKAISKKQLDKYSEIYCKYVSMCQTMNKKTVEPELAKEYGYKNDRRIRQIVEVMHDRLSDGGVKQHKQNSIIINLLVKEGHCIQAAHSKLSEMKRNQLQEYLDFKGLQNNRKTYLE